MKDLVIIHNPRCSKSRQTLELLESRGLRPEVIDYLNGGLTRDLLEKIVSALDLPPRELVRTKEDEFKDLNLNLDDSEAVLQTLLQHPKLLERPIVLLGSRAAIGRPPENVLSLF